MHCGLWPADRREALYTEAGAPLVWNPQATSRRLGWELDFQADWQFSERVQSGFGSAHFFPGPYWKQSTARGGFRYPYVMWAYRF